MTKSNSKNHFRLLKTLKRIIASSIGSEYGSQYGVNIKWTIKDFQREVPIIDYKNIIRNIEEAYDGKKNVFSNEPIISWAMTSGTTSKPKFIPYTKSFIDDYSKAERRLFIQLIKKYPYLLAGKIAIMVGKGKNFISPKGIIVGSTSGLMADKIPRLFKHRIIGLPSEVDEIDDSIRISYIARKAIECDLRAIITSSSTFLLDFLNIVESISTKQNINELWPKLKFIGFPTGGYAAFHKHEISRILTKASTFDTGFGASEGYLSVPVGIDEPIGVPNDDIYFLEFVPIHNGNYENKAVTINEVNDEVYYKLIVSSRNGILRYSMGDIVSFEKYYDKKVMRYVMRSNLEVSILGERITEDQVIHSINYAQNSMGIKLSDFIFLAPSKDEVPPYKYLMILKNDEWKYLSRNNWIRFVENIDFKLKEINANYNNIRTYSSMLKAPDIFSVTSEKMSVIKEQARQTSIFSGQGKATCLISNHDKNMLSRLVGYRNI
jgi:hypothetical protein